MVCELSQLKKQVRALTGVVQWVGHHPANSSILFRFPVWAHAWVADQGPGWGRAEGDQLTFLLHIDVSLPLFLPPFPAL